MALQIYNSTLAFKPASEVVPCRKHCNLTDYKDQDNVLIYPLLIAEWKTCLL